MFIALEFHYHCNAKKSCGFCGSCDSLASDLRRCVLVDRCRSQTVNALHKEAECFRQHQKQRVNLKHEVNLTTANCNTLPEYNSHQLSKTQVNVSPDKLLVRPSIFVSDQDIHIYM